jgi:hypothetical protein
VGLTQSLLVSNLEFAEAQIYESQQRKEKRTEFELLVRAIASECWGRGLHP